MYSNLRSLIFKLDPEKAHTLAIQSLKFNLVSNIFDENKSDPTLKTKIFGKELLNPIGIAAGFDDLILARAKIGDLYLLIMAHIFWLTCNEYPRFIHYGYHV